MFILTILKVMDNQEVDDPIPHETLDNTLYQMTP